MNFDTYEIGTKNKNGKEISKIYYKVEGKYIIYATKNESMIFFDGSEEIQKNISSISKQLAKIEIITNDKKDNGFVNTQLIYAISTAAEGNITAAKEILNELEINIINMQKNDGRVQYLLGSISAIIFLVVIMIIGALVNHFMNIKIISQNDNLIYMSILGGLGGFLSVIRRITSIDIDSNYGFCNNFISGMSRIIISIICGICTFYLIKSNIFLGILNNIDKDTSSYATYLLGIVSGFSENFVPNLFNKIETETINKSIKLDS